jgi:hypothetical protein
VESEDCVPVPATVEMIPDDETARTLWPSYSAMKRVPTESCHTPLGPLMVAEVACPPSPEEDADPLPDTVATRYHIIIPYYYRIIILIPYLLRSFLSQ